MANTKLEFFLKQLTKEETLSRRVIKALEECPYDEATMKRALDYLIEKKVSRPRIITNAHLIARNPASLERNYEGNLVELAGYHIGKTIEEKTLGENDVFTYARGFLAHYPTLFGVTRDTTIANMEFLVELEYSPIKHDLYVFLSSRKSTKERRKELIREEIFAPNMNVNIDEAVMTYLRDGNQKLLTLSSENLRSQKEKLTEEARKTGYFN
ncbi:MAG: hypothetical protein AABX19_03515 [Nanoarchaeota archaeon]